MKKPGKGFIQGFDWVLYPKAEKFLKKEVKNFLRNNVFAKKLAKRMQKETSTEIFDWIDHLILPEKRVSEKKLKSLNFKQAQLKAQKGIKVFKNPDTIFFPVLLTPSNTAELALKPEYLNHLVKKLGKQGKIQGEKYSPYRKAIINTNEQSNYILTAIERRGSNDFIIKNLNDIKEYKKALEIFAKRKRYFKSDEKGLLETKKLIKKVLKTLSKERVADAFFRNERSYWQKRNKSGQIQHSRQNKLGLGWGNHDHHTYRSSREHFTKLIEIFELVGYNCRERFYAGEKAGWGAQILEHPQCDIVLFADTNITKKEKDKDFAHRGLKHERKLGTVGLWIGLHGESILQSGMHHLEARFNFNKLRKDLKKQGIKTMKPFSHFKFLKQAFTQGAIWKVDKKRADKLLKDNSITKEQHDEFLKKGAIGSHMENLQRRQGFKGFNQTSVTAIIKATNPLKQLLKKEQARGA